MKLLLDTHVLIWALTDDPRLSGDARRLISDPENLVCFSVASLWEIAIKNQKRPEKCPYHEKEVSEFCAQAGFQILAVLKEHVLALRELKIVPGGKLLNMDPFDRILIAQARCESGFLLTHDANLANYLEPCVRMI